MTARLTIGFTAAEGTVVRMLGLVERRGYILRGLAMDERDDSPSIVIDAEPRDSGRRAEVLAAQLRRIVGVTIVSLATREPGSPQ